MTPVKQTRFSDPSKGIHGNCMTACFASLFDLPLEKVPDFITIEKEGKDWIQVMLDFIWDQGCEFNGRGFSEHISMPEYNHGIDGYVIVGGPSPRGKVIAPSGHAVIYKDGKPFFDPHPSNDFLLEVEDFYIIERRK